MLTSQSIDNLDPAAREKSLRQIYGILSAMGAAGAAAINVAVATKKDLPDFWKPVPEK